MVALLSALVLLITCALPVGAYASGEGTQDCTYVPITSDGFVADTLNGVEARYNKFGNTIYCVELIDRYYREVYGMDIRTSGSAPVVLGNDTFYFEKTNDPKTGDIMFGSAAARSKSYNHWSLVKSTTETSITCFEQNWTWNGQAGIDRIIDYPTSYYEFYTLKSTDGSTPKVINGSMPYPSEWAQDYVTSASNLGIANLTEEYQAHISRDDFSQMAVNTASNFGFVAEGTGSAGALSLGLLTSTEDAAQAISRQEAAVVLTRLVTLVGTLPQVSQEASSQYEDMTDIEPWALDSISILTACGLMSGTTGKFNPYGAVTNEQAASLFVRIAQTPEIAPIEAIVEIEGDNNEFVLMAPASMEMTPLAEPLAQEVVALCAEDMMISRIQDKAV